MKQIYFGVCLAITLLTVIRTRGTLRAAMSGTFRAVDAALTNGHALSSAVLGGLDSMVR